MHDLGVPRQGRRPDALRLVDHPLQHVPRGVDQPALARVRYGAQHDQVTHPIQEVDGEAAWVVPGVHQAVDGVEHGGAVLGGEGVHRVVDQRHVGNAQQRECPRVRHPLGARTGEQLVEHAQ